MIRAISAALPVASKRDTVARRQARARTAQAPPASSATRPRRVILPPVAIATSQKSRCTSIPTALNTDLLTS